MEKVKNKTKIIYNAVSYSVYALLFITFCVFVSMRMSYLLDADMSSEMILAELIADGGKILVKDWYYSTELRVFYMQLFMSPLFKIASSWHVIRVVATIILVALFQASLFFFMCSIGQKKFFPLVGIVFLLPISQTYFYFIIYGLYYTQNLMLAFLILGLIFYLMKIENKKINGVLFAILLCLSFLAGLCGTRNVINIFLPMGVCAFFFLMINIKKEKFKYWKRFFFIVLFSCIAGAVGFAIYHFALSKAFGVASFGYKNSLKLGFNRAGIINVFNALFHMLGFNGNNNIFLFIILFALLVTMFVFAFKKSSKLSSDENFIALFILICLGIYLSIYTFTNMNFSENFLIPFVIFTIFVIVGLFRNFSSTKYKFILKSVALGVVCLVFIINSSVSYTNLWKTDKTYNQRAITNVLLENECYEGYATFWNGNILTELSSGKIRVRHINQFAYGETNIDNSYNWLQQKSLIERKPQGKVFVVFTTHEYQSFELAKSFDNLDYLKFDNGEVKVFIYDSYEEMVAVTEVAHNF